MDQIWIGLKKNQNKQKLDENRRKKDPRKIKELQK